ncbi:acyl-CoA N-acyltransferase [Rhodocollybia butyracea]|uniref:Acyl-CoA N-acyltransferase n=1 Tax=Rhodocollybia butyracea TaxID=206335 RepID=A0A9P5UCS9_9AGAR|nr:acyl-CoA N-acyltransferase [Rhodocollybia butyracea]
MFETTNLHLRFPHSTDYDKLLDLWNDARVQKMLSTNYIIPLGAKFGEGLRPFASDALMYCVMETKDTSDWVGFICLFEAETKNRSAKVGLGLLPEFWGRGYAKQALCFIVDYAFQELALHRVALTVFESNIVARALYKKIGFVEEGVDRKANWVDGRWQDVIRMSILDEEWVALKQDTTRP